MKKTLFQTQYLVGLAVILAFLAGLFFSRLHLFDRHQKFDDSRQFRERSILNADEKASLINPLLECDVAEGMIDVYKENFRDELELVIDDLQARNEASAVAVYFRDLNNGPTFGVNEDEQFIPASLLKVPVMMAYFRLADEDPSILSKTLTLPARADLVPGSTQLIAPKSEIEAGRPYTTAELIERTIIYSDNQAVTLLIQHLPGGPIRRLYEMLGVREDVLNGPDGQLTTKEYSAFFRILFNSSYLSRKYSEEALRLLTKTEFPRGLVAGVPSGVVVAHKFGEGGDMDEHQIHDCGIVYFPDHPYLLCVMTRGKEIAKLEHAVATISRMVYEKIDAEYGKRD